MLLDQSVQDTVDVMRVLARCWRVDNVYFLKFTMRQTEHLPKLFTLKDFLEQSGSITKFDLITHPLSPVEHPFILIDDVDVLFQDFWAGHVVGKLSQEDHQHSRYLLLECITLLEVTSFESLVILQQKSPDVLCFLMNSLLCLHIMT